MTETFTPEESCARELDRRDPLGTVRSRFLMPQTSSGRDAIYLCGNSLGLQPSGVRDAIEQELDDWARLAVDAHHDGANPWFAYHERFSESGARLVGAEPGEVVMMNSLTTNLHLLMVSFYRPTTERHQIVIEDDAFPSDSYAVASQVAFHGFDPESVVRLRARDGEKTLRTEDILAFLEREGDSVALLMLGGVNYLTGQWFDMESITAAAHAQGCTVGWDLAHAAGNVPLRLHDWGVDFAAWCSYKYLNAGPGAVAGAFVHSKHARDVTRPRFAGWWGNNPDTRFRMDKAFELRAGADGWQLSNPPILALAPLRASLDVFDDVGMEAIRTKSLLLTGYLEFLINDLGPEFVEIVTPRDPSQRGAQLSTVVRAPPRDFQKRLHAAGIVTDFREPDIIRASPIALYNRFHDVWQFVQILRSLLETS